MIVSFGRLVGCKVGMEVRIGDGDGVRMEMEVRMGMG